MRFASIDFETANYRADSPCQLAIVVVEEGQIQSEHCWLIRPRRLYFSERCVAVHGITVDVVRNAPQWDAIWPDVVGLLEGTVIIAHNASFDLRVLQETLATYDLVCPSLEYSCTRLIARRTWPGRHGYGLKPIAESLGISFQHHDALEDARTCARIALASAACMQSTSFDDLEQSLAITRGRVRFGAMVGPRCIRRSRRQEESVEPKAQRSYGKQGWPESASRARERLATVDRLVEANQSNLPLNGKSVVLSGCLLGMNRQDAVQFLQRLGARVQDHMNLQTQYLILGQPESETAPFSQPMSDEHRENQVMERKSQGQPISILSQRQLLKLIPGGMEAARSLTRVGT